MFPSRRIAVLGGDAYRDDYSVAYDGANDNLGSNFMPSSPGMFILWSKEPSNISSGILPGNLWIIKNLDFCLGVVWMEKKCLM